MKAWLLVGIFLLGLIPVLYRLHLVEKDFFEILGAADGFLIEHNYCFMEIKDYVGLSHLTGLQGRPPFIPLLLAGAFTIFGHSLKSIYLVYSLPRLIIFPLLFLISLKFFKPKIAYCVSSLGLFFPFFETYALATLKADVFVVAWSLAGLYFYLRWKKTKKHRDLFLSSFFLCLNILSKETALYFSISLWIFLLFDAKQALNKKAYIVALIAPIISLVGPFILYSIITTNRIFPSIFATAFDLASFPINIRTYISSMFFFTGISFNQGKLLAFSSLLKISLILIGIFYAIKGRKYELVFPIFAVLISISLIHTRVVQGDAFNREIVHRIALTAPFVSLFIGFGVLFITKIITKKHYQSLCLVLCVLTELLFIKHYFSAPYALNYTSAEFYVTALTVFRHSPNIPLSTFEAKNKLCVMKTITAGTFLHSQYDSLKSSAFPEGFKELMIFAWIVPLLMSFFVKQNGYRS